MVAIRGGTGIKVCGNSDLQEPLLVDEEPGCVKVNPYRDDKLIFNTKVKIWREFLRNMVIRLYDISLEWCYIQGIKLARVEEMIN